MFKRTAFALITLSLFPLQSMALDCADGLSHVTVSGDVTTMNASAKKQVGQICMKLQAVDGSEVLNECGGLIGNVVSADESTGTTILTHTAAFDPNNVFKTSGDVAQATGYPDGCKLPVVEHMTQLEGRGIFKDATIDVWATGNVSMCPGQPNTFTLLGEACVKQ